jgi:hypothetical protein
MAIFRPTGRRNQEAKPADPGEIGAALNVSREIDEQLQQLADREQCILLAFISPYTPMRVSPSEVAYATIGLEEEFGIETVINEVKGCCPEVQRLYFLINSPGGGVPSSYKVARALRTTFKEIRAFVPHVAASGASLLAIGGNEIVMGLMSNLSPLDVQMLHKDTNVSTTTFVRSFERWSRVFAKKTKEEAPFPQQLMVEKLDPIIMEEVGGIIHSALSCVQEILSLAGYGDRAPEIADRLFFEFGYHGAVIHADLAEAIGLNVKRDSQYPEEWRLMRQWLGRYLYKSAPVHFIRYVTPSLTGEASEAPSHQEEGEGGATKPEKKGRPRRRPPNNT